ncbi:MAG: molybdopterin molybdotransferase MoeA [Acidilobaceae archaeon]
MTSSSGFKKLKSLTEVVEETKRWITHRPTAIEVSLEKALGKVLAEDITAPFNLPVCKRSLVDGYAVHSVDTVGSGLYKPARLKLVGFIRVGDKPNLKLGSGEAVEVSTGACLPEGADAVVMYEHSRRVSEKEIEIYAPVAPGSNVSVIGEDFREGETLLKKGVRLLPWDLAIIAVMGIKKVKVYDLRVAILSIGNELVELENVENPLKVYSEGKVINTNRFAIAAMVERLGFTPDYLGLLPDDESVVSETVARALRTHDAVITLGGASVGRVDVTVSAVSKLKPEYLAHGILIRPGRANSVAVVNGKPVFMLSGFPVAAIVGFEAIVEPVLNYMVGARAEVRPTLSGTLLRRVTTPYNMRSYVRVRVFRGEDGKIYVEPLAVTGSGVLSTLVKGNGLLIVPETREGYDEGDLVEVVLYRGVEE